MKFSIRIKISNFITVSIKIMNLVQLYSDFDRSDKMLQIKVQLYSHITAPLLTNLHINACSQKRGKTVYNWVWFSLLRKLNSIYQIWFNNCASIPGIWKQNSIYMWGWALKLKFAEPHTPYITLFCNVNSMVVTLASWPPPTPKLCCIIYGWCLT